MNERGPGGEPSVKGRLIYCKASLTGDEDQDLLCYRRRNRSFAHLSTVNQWFAESVFEAYRALGLHIGRTAAAAYSRRISDRRPEGPDATAAPAARDAIEQAASAAASMPG